MAATSDLCVVVSIDRSELRRLSFRESVGRAEKKAGVICQRGGGEGGRGRERGRGREGEIEGERER